MTSATVSSTIVKRRVRVLRHYRYPDVEDLNKFTKFSTRRSSLTPEGKSSTSSKKKRLKADVYAPDMLQ